MVVVVMLIYSRTGQAACGYRLRVDRRIVDSVHSNYLFQTLSFDQFFGLVQDYSLGCV